MAPENKTEDSKIRGLEDEMHLPFLRVVDDFEHDDVVECSEIGFYNHAKRTIYKNVCLIVPRFREPELIYYKNYVSADILNTRLQSPVLNTMLENRIEGILTIEVDTSPAVLGTLVDWLYTGRLVPPSVNINRYFVFIHLLNLYHFLDCWLLERGLKMLPGFIQSRKYGNVTIKDIVEVPDELQHPYPWIQHMLMVAHNEDVDKGYQPDYTDVDNAILVKLMNVRSGKETCPTVVDGKYVVARDDEGEWYVAKILERTHDYTHVHFVGWTKKWELMISREKCKQRIKPIKKGGKYWCRSCDSYHKTRTQIIEYVRDFISEHYSDDTFTL
jgi:hypothetical protein